MSITISLGSWIVPAVITIVAIIFCIYTFRKDQGSGFGAGFVSAIVTIAAIGMVAVAWFVFLTTKLLK